MIPNLVDGRRMMFLSTNILGAAYVMTEIQLVSA